MQNIYVDREITNHNFNRASVSGDAVGRIWDDIERCGAVINCGELNTLGGDGR
jgi:hypothetical protein